MSRGLFGAALALLAVPAAWAHPVGDAHGGFQATLSGVQPLVLGLQIAVVGGDQRLRLANLSDKTIVVLDADGQPFLRFTNRVVERYDHTSDAWHQVALGTTYEWPEPRISWNSESLPPAVAADPTRSHLIREWEIPGRADGEPFRIKGFLGWGPHAVSGAGSEESGGGVGAFLVAFALTAVAIAAGVLLYRERRRASSSSRSA